MGKCRICLKTKIKLFSVNNINQGLTYASMIEFISAVKIMEESDDMICQSCCRKVKDFYSFKLVIEKSNLILNGLTKVYKFNNINDIGHLVKTGQKMLNHKLHQENTPKNGSVCFYYSDTLIKRLSKEDTMESIKPETATDDYMKLSDVDTRTNDNEEYFYEKKKKTLKCKKKREKTTCLKPVYLKDLRILKRNANDREKSKIQTKRVREDICPYCGKNTKYIRCHILKHTAERKFFCNDCHRSFYTKSSLEYHIKSHLTKIKLKCDHCIDTFSSKAALKTHMAVHIDVKKFICKICEKAFKWRSGMTRHMLSHGMAKRFECDQCTMTFLTKYHLRHHSRVHTRERPYKCEICSQPYSYKRDFNRHCLKKHGVFIDLRPVYILNEQILQQEKALMKDIMLRMHGMKTDKEPLDYFQGPRGAQAFAKAVRLLESKKFSVPDL